MRDHGIARPRPARAVGAREAQPAAAHEPRAVDAERSGRRAAARAHGAEDEGDDDAAHVVAEARIRREKAHLQIQ